MNLVESTWNPVKIGGGSGGYTINNYAVSSGWYNQHIDAGGARTAKLRSFYNADCDSIEISRALDILAEDISSSNADDNDIFYIDYPDDTKVKKTLMKTVNSVLGMWNNRTEMDIEFFNRVRDTLKAGSSFFKKNEDGTLTKLYQERFVGYILSENDEDYVTHYIYDPTLPRIDQGGKNNINKSLVSTARDKHQIIPVDEMLIMKVGDGPFGQSVIERVYKIYRQLSLLEDSVIIYRVVRAPERRVYYIDVGNLQGPKREQAIERQRLRLMQKQINKAGQTTTEYDPHSTSEDIFIPTNSTGKGSRIETLPGGQGLGEMGDVEYFAKKMAKGLRIPSSMTDEEQPNQFNDMRVGQVYQVEVRYMGYVRRIARFFERTLSKHFREFAMNRGVIVPDDAKFKISESMSFSMYKEMELNQTLLNIASSTMSFEYLGKKFVLQKYMNLDQEEIQQNEDYKLMEMGIPAEKLKDMTEEERSNLVYSQQKNPAIMKKFGLESEEGGFGGGRF